MHDHENTTAPAGPHRWHKFPRGPMCGSTTASRPYPSHHPPAIASRVVAVQWARSPAAEQSTHAPAGRPLGCPAVGTAAAGQCHLYPISDSSPPGGPLLPACPAPPGGPPHASSPMLPLLRSMIHRSGAAARRCRGSCHSYVLVSHAERVAWCVSQRGGRRVSASAPPPALLALPPACTAAAPKPPAACCVMLPLFVRPSCPFVGRTYKLYAPPCHFVGRIYMWPLFVRPPCPFVGRTYMLYTPPCTFVGRVYMLDAYTCASPLPQQRRTVPCPCGT